MLKNEKFFKITVSNLKKSMDELQHDFGEHIISADNSLKSHFMRFLAMKSEERRELFRAAKADGKAYFSPRPGIHLVLKRKPNGTYILEKN